MLSCLSPPRFPAPLEGLALRDLVPGISCRNPPPPRRDAREKALFAYDLADIRMERSSLEGSPCSKCLVPGALPFDVLSGGSVLLKAEENKYAVFSFLKSGEGFGGLMKASKGPRAGDYVERCPLL